MAQDVNENAGAGQSTTRKSKAGLLALAKPIAFVSVIVVVEIVAASVFVPSAEETERLGHELVAAAHGHASHGAEGDSDHHYAVAHDIREVKLGTYNITRYNPANNMTRAIDFELFGTVLADDLSDFEHLLENSRARIREQVIMTLHSAESNDLTDAGLGLLKRQILEKTNRALGQPLLREVLFSKFNFVER